ncbi:DUF4189 domain-containing protein [Achromobacter pulmonis]|uniref:DUF4189 domain-containing protein n=1 Tax=Achromobacter pulmonis TaxID=1389932 RepID=UPI003C7456A4
MPYSRGVQAPPTALDAIAGKVGAAGSRKSRQPAENDSDAVCANKGGGDGREQVSHAKQCGAIVWGNGIALSRIAPTLEAATDRVLAECKQERGGDGEVCFYDCSMPVRVQ